MQHLAPEASKPTLLRAPKVGLNNGWKTMLSSLSVLQHRGWGGGGFHIKFQILLTNLWDC